MECSADFFSGKPPCVACEWCGQQHEWVRPGKTQQLPDEALADPETLGKLHTIRCGIDLAAFASKRADGEERDQSDADRQRDAGRDRATRGAVTTRISFAIASAMSPRARARPRSRPRTWRRCG